MAFNSHFKSNEIEHKLGLVHRVPTLDHEPTESDLSYTDETLGEVAFNIGDEVRVADSSNNYGYSFYKLFDITGESAAWGKIYPCECQSNDSSDENDVPIDYGVYIINSDGKYYTPDDWDTSDNDNAIAVAIIDDSCRFLFDYKDYSESVPWSIELASTLVEGCSTNSNSSEAYQDFSGENNSYYIRQAAPDESASDNAAHWCYQHTITVNGTEVHGYLLSIGEMARIYKYIDSVNLALTILDSPVTITGNNFVCSTQNSETFYWGLYIYETGANGFMTDKTMRDRKTIVAYPIP